MALFLQYLFWVFIVVYSIIKSSRSIGSLISSLLYDLITRLFRPSKRKVIDFKKGILSLNSVIIKLLIDIVYAPIEFIHIFQFKIVEKGLKRSKFPISAKLQTFLYFNFDITIAVFKHSPCYLIGLLSYKISKILYTVHIFVNIFSAFCTNMSLQFLYVET